MGVCHSLKMYLNAQKDDFFEFSSVSFSAVVPDMVVIVKIWQYKSGAM